MILSLLNVLGHGSPASAGVSQALELKQNINSDLTEDLK